MYTTLLGMTTSANVLQKENAPSPILVTLFGMTTSANVLQKENAPSPILVTLFGMKYDVCF